MATLTEFLKGIADALRTKKGTIDPIPAPNFAQEILGIQTGTDTSDATATAADILSGKTAYGASGKMTGTIPSKTESDITVSGPTVNVPAGHYAVQAQKSVTTVDLATPEIMVNTTGLVHATVLQPEGYVAGGRKGSDFQIDTEVGRTVTPGTSDVELPVSSKFMLGNIRVAGDQNLIPENIKNGVSVFGVSGTAEIKQEATVSVTVNASTDSGVSYFYTSDGQKYVKDGESVSLKSEVGGLLVAIFDIRPAPDVGGNGVEVLRIVNDIGFSHVGIKITEPNASIYFA